MTLTLSSSGTIKIPSTETVSSTAPESFLVRYIQAHVKQGEKAKERADQARDKAEQHFIAAGQYLAMLKVTYAPTWQQWEILLRVKVGLSTSRAGELMQLADGRKSLQEVRDATAQRVRALRFRRSSPLQDQCNGEEEANQSGAAPPSTAPALSLIDALARSNSAVRAAAADALISGARQAQFEAVVDAVGDLYQRLSRAGR